MQWAVFFCVSSAAIAVASLPVAFWLVKRASAAAELPAGKLRSLESRLGSLEASVTEWSETTTEIANRVKMMRVRNQTAGPRSSADRMGLPDPYTDPDAWRKAMNAKLALRNLNGGA